VTIVIEAFTFSGYRSFTTAAVVAPLNQVNIFIGQNNSGKSNILRFLHEVYSHALESAQSGKGNVNIKPEDVPQGQSPYGQFTIGFGMQIGGRLYDQALKAIPGGVRSLADTVFRMPLFTNGTDFAYFNYRCANNSPVAMLPNLVAEITTTTTLSVSDWEKASAALANTSSSGSVSFNVQQVVPRIIPIHLFAQRPFSLIADTRKIGGAGVADRGYSGHGIIEQLAALQNPPYNEQSKRELFEKINEFVRGVLGNDTALLEIPYDRTMIVVHMDGKTLPLSSLGTGIHEVIMMAVQATLLQNQVVCIEEPETHLHPTLQKQLMGYLLRTNNQYFISTHSVHLLDTAEASIFHVRLEEGSSTIEHLETDSHKSEACTHLGYRASDLMQSNCIVWVEGPTDRTYLNHWIRAIDPSVICGLHYSVMFYGGKLLSHLSADDHEVTDFISLRRLNRFIAIVIDRDRARSSVPINTTKQRVVTEFDKGPGFAWVTQGREIENYIPTEIRENAIKQVHRNAARLSGPGIFNHGLRFLREDGETERNPDKVAIAKIITELPPNLDVLDLRERVTQLVDFIHHANGYRERKQS